MFIEENLIELLGQKGEIIRIRESGLAEWVKGGYYVVNLKPEAKKGRPRKAENADNI